MCSFAFNLIVRKGGLCCRPYCRSLSSPASISSPQGLHATSAEPPLKPTASSQRSMHCGRRLRSPTLSIRSVGAYPDASFRRALRGGGCHSCPCAASRGAAASAAEDAAPAIPAWSRDDTLVLFDIDGTLTEPRRAMAPATRAFLEQLRTRVAIGVVGAAPRGARPPPPLPPSRDRMLCPQFLPRFGKEGGGGTSLASIGTRIARVRR